MSEKSWSVDNSRERLTWTHSPFRGHPLYVEEVREVVEALDDDGDGVCLALAAMEFVSHLRRWSLSRTRYTDALQKALQQPQNHPQIRSAPHWNTVFHQNLG